MLFRLIKLGVYTLIGYALYEIYLGMTQGQAPRGQPMSGGSRTLRNALNRDTGRMNLTGPGRGTTVSTSDANGAETPHVVGRGAVPSA